MRHCLLILCAALLISLAGCNTVDSRIKQKEYVFDRLDPQTQTKLRQGMVEVGYTADMVYIALGAPDAQHQKVTAHGSETTWIYKTYYEQYEGMAHVGYRRMVFFDPVTHFSRVYYEPVSTPVYSEQEEENIRIAFVNGKVAAIEQNKR